MSLLSLRRGLWVVEIVAGGALLAFVLGTVLSLSLLGLVSAWTLDLPRPLAVVAWAVGYDLGRLVGLVGAAALLGRLMVARVWPVTVGLVVVAYALEAAMLLLVTDPWMAAVQPLAWVTRGAMGAAGLLVTAWVYRWASGQRPARPSQGPIRLEGGAI